MANIRREPLYKTEKSKDEIEWQTQTLISAFPAHCARCTNRSSTSSASRLIPMVMAGLAREKANGDTGRHGARH